MKVAICVPLPEHTSNSFNKNLIEIITYTRSHVKEVTDLSYLTRSGVRTDRNRNYLINDALENDFDYILWLDADMVYPANIIEKYLSSRPFDIIGCVYFKRTHPYHPVLYVDGTNPIKPYKMVDPTKLEQDKVYEVDGLGFGGVMVKTDVYKTMGDDKYMNYGINYHLPHEMEGQLTHDLEWCKKAKSYGYKIYVHTGVYAGHITEKIVGVEDFIKAREDKPEKPKTRSVNILIPTINPEKAKQCADLCHLRAGYPHKIIVEEDANKIGWVAMINKMARENPAELYIYGADDMYPSRGFLKEAVDTMEQTNAGLVGFNEGKFQEYNAGFGLVDYSWVKGIYGGDLLFSGYKSHYSEPELTLIAKGLKRFAYNPRACLIEIVYNKDGDKSKTVSNNKDDKMLFHTRKSSGFDGLVSDKSILSTIN